MAHDFLGNELSIGDYVVFLNYNGTSSNLESGIITRVSEHTAEISGKRRAEYKIVKVNPVKPTMDSTWIPCSEQNKIEDLKYNAQEREKHNVYLQKQWQAAEMFICTMCGHFDYDIDGNIVYGNKDCGEIVGYPCCKKFTPWIPCSERLPEPETEVLVVCRRGGVSFVCPAMYEDGKMLRGESIWNWNEIEGYGLYSEEADDWFVPEGWWEYRQFNDDDVYNNIIDCAVTHWMPLPEPPEEGSTEK